jgi:hypothetical protein
MTSDDAIEFTEALEQTGEGWFRQLALGIKLKVPEALGLTRRDWCDRVGLKVRNRAARQQISFELHTEGIPKLAIADVLGVDRHTVDADLNVQNSPQEKSGQEEELIENVQNSPPNEALIDDDEADDDEAGDDEEEDEEDRRLREINELNDETRQAKLYASLFYMPAREICQMLDDGEKAENVVGVMRRRRYVLKVDVTPMELKKAGEMFIQLAKQETK